MSSDSEQTNGLKKLKVLHIITRLIVGGAQENTIYTCHLLDRAKYDVDLLIGPQLGPEGELVSIVKKDRVALTVENSLVREINPVKDLMALLRLRGFIKKNGYDIVHTHSSKAGIVGRIAAWMARTPVVVHTVHGWGFHDHMHPLKRGLYVFLEKICRRISDRLIVVTQLDADAGMKYGIGVPDDYEKIYSAIDLDEFSSVNIDVEAKKKELGLAPNAPVVGCVGRLSPQKAPDIFMRMAAEVLKSNPRVNFLYVGGGPLRSDIEALIEELGIADRVVLTGLRRDVPELLHVMDVFVLLSLWEGLPRVFSQAMAAGLPVVASNVGGAAEVVHDGKNGYVVPPGDYQAPAQRVLELVADPQLRENMGAEGRKVADPDFDVHHMVRRIHELYQDIMKQKGFSI